MRRLAVIEDCSECPHLVTVYGRGADPDTTYCEKTEENIIIIYGKNYIPKNCPLPMDPDDPGEAHTEIFNNTVQASLAC